MGKNKPRHNLDKKQNKYGNKCWLYDDSSNTCEHYQADCNICKGNPHNCVKVKYHKLAITKNEKPISSRYK